MHHDPAITRGMHVELDAVSVQNDRPAKSRTRVFVFVSGSAAMGDDAGASHGLTYSHQSAVGSQECEHAASRDSRPATRDSRLATGDWRLAINKPIPKT